MALFLDQPSLYLLLSRELPEDVYPFAADASSFWSTASLAAKAEVLKNAYAALEQAYDNYWPQTADEDGIAQHEIARVGSLSSGLTLQERRDRILARMRALPSLSRPDLTLLVKSELPDGTIVKLVPMNSLQAGAIDGGTWYLDESELGVDTFLGAYGPHAYPPDTDLCQKDGSEIGLSPTEWAEYQTQACTYEVRIYDYTPTADELAAIDAALLEAEGAARAHQIGLYRTTMERLPDLASTSLHLEADYWDGGATWLDSSGSGNHATRVGVPTLEDSANFYARKVIRGGSGKGFHAPGDNITGSTKRTYEIVVDDWGTGVAEQLIARIDGGPAQIANWLYKNTSVVTESSVWDSTATAPWAGGTSYSIVNVNSKPVLFHVVFDAVARTIDVYQNGTHITQNNNPLHGSLGASAGIELGIFGRWNGSALSDHFTGTIMELARHEEKFDQSTITARVAEFNRLKGY